MADSTTIVIFGASGDLTQRKLIPALFNLYRKQRLPADFRIVGFATTHWQDADFCAAMRAGVEQHAERQFTAEQWAAFEARLFYRAGAFTEAADFARLATTLTELESGPADRLYYLAAPPRFYADIVNRLGAADIVREDEGWRHVIVEKPFGADLASAQALNLSIHRVLDEKQIYRIDHYLGKETVQNILVLRFANAIFGPMWNRNYIDHVQITVAESAGVEHRAGYYDRAGVLRDMFQNHLLQLLALTAMEPPAAFDADSLRNEKVKVLKAIPPIRPDQVGVHTVRGQYRRYCEEEDVAPTRTRRLMPRCGSSSTTWNFTTPIRLGRARFRRLMSDSCSTPCMATPRYSRAVTVSSWPGNSSQRRIGMSRGAGLIPVTNYWLSDQS